MTMSAKPSIVSPLPWITVAGWRGVQISASRAQLALTTFGTTTSSGYASAACAASSAWAVLPRPGSSASRNVRWPDAAADITCPWWCISSMPCAARRDFGSGSLMHDESPPCSNDRNSGPSSSQLARRPAALLRCATEEKSGARKGLASCLLTTDCGTTRRSGAAEVATGSFGVAGSGAGSSPAASSISRLSDLAASETTASSASNASSEVSRAAVLARIVAIPSRRLSCSARCASLLARSALTRARSSRTSRATTWNLVRPEGRTGPRWAPASTSRTARASTGMMPSLSRSRARRWLRGAVRVAPDWCWPRRAKKSSFGVPAMDVAWRDRPTRCPRGPGLWDVDAASPGGHSATQLHGSARGRRLRPRPAANDVEPTDLRSMTAIRRAEVDARGAAWPRAGTPQIVAPFAPHVDRGAVERSGRCRSALQGGDPAQSGQAVASARSVRRPAAQSAASAQPQLLPWRVGVPGPVTPPAPGEGDDQEPDDAAQDREGDPRDHDNLEDGVCAGQDPPPSP